MAPKQFKRTRILMGAPLEITASGDESFCSRAIEAAFQEVARIESRFTIYRPESPLSRFNASSKKDLVSLDQEILEVLFHAIRLSEKSGGAFDPSSGRLIDLWGFGPGGEVEIPPTREAISSALRFVGARFLKVDLERGVLECSQEGLQINLGGIAKGYAIDRAVQILKEHQVQRGLVSFGSTLYAFGHQGWQIAIQHPRKKTGEIASISLVNQALSTSGDYERYFLFKGRRYSHLIDPRTGYPVSGMAAVSVTAPTAMTADVCSTAAFVLGPDEGKIFLENYSEVEGVIIAEPSSGPLKLTRTKRWSGEVEGESVTRRRLLAVTCSLLLGFVLPGGLLRPDDSEGAYRFATEKEALERMFPDADQFDQDDVKLTDKQLSQSQELAGKGFRKKNYRFLVGKKGNEIIGYSLQLNVVGKERPITFLIGLTPEAQVKGIEILIYRETKGSRVRSRQFMKQFKNKTKDDPLRLGRDIRPISGATLSSRATAYAVRKALAIFQVIYIEGIK